MGYGDGYDNEDENKNYNDEFVTAKIMHDKGKFTMLCCIIVGLALMIWGAVREYNSWDFSTNGIRTWAAVRYALDDNGNRTDSAYASYVVDGIEYGAWVKDHGPESDKKVVTSLMGVTISTSIPIYYKPDSPGRAQGCYERTHGVLILLVGFGIELFSISSLQKRRR